MDIVFATKNRGKIKEIKEIMKDTPFSVYSLEDMGLDIDVIEDGTTYEENALKKATEIMKACGKIALADDSGLEVDFLDKAPGVYSARYLGEDTPYSIKNNTIIDKLKHVPDEKRTARFVCVIAAAIPNAETFTVRATIEGIIAKEEKGTNGFGYDPVLYVPEHEMTTAQMPVELKNQLSHRGKAMRLMTKKLMELLGV